MMINNKNLRLKYLVLLIMLPGENLKYAMFPYRPELNNLAGINFHLIWACPGESRLGKAVLRPVPSYKAPLFPR